jgi:hypothetical protein
VTDRDPAVQALLERTPPADIGPRDWDDVVRRFDARAGVVPPRRRRLVLAVALAVALLALAVNPAFGVGDHVLDWFRGSPAPERVKRDLAELDPPPAVRALFSGPGVLAEETRGVVALETSAGTAYLWAAPTAGGGWCRYVEIPEVASSDGAFGSAGTSGGSGSVCDAAPPAATALEGSLEDAASGEKIVLRLVEGFAGPGIAEVSLRFADGGAVPLRLVDGFFLAEAEPRRRVTALVGLDGAGEEVARVPLTDGEYAGPPPAKEEPPPAEPARTVVQIALSGGASARLSVRPLTAPGCFELTVAGSGWEEQSASCPAPGSRLVPNLAYTEGGKALVLLSGFAAPQIARLELRHEDGFTRAVPLTEGFYLVEIPRDRLAPGRLPVLLVGRGRDGAVVERSRLRVE